MQSNKAALCRQQRMEHFLLRCFQCFVSFFTAYEQAVVPWIDGRDVKLCPTCAKHFHVARRKHHCRLCGAIMCHDCTQFLPLTLASMFFHSYVKVHTYFNLFTFQQDAVRFNLLSKTFRYSDSSACIGSNLFYH
jgi:hypothetical protein